MAGRDAATDRAPWRASSRRPSVRGRVAISLGVSGLAHAALFAWVTVSVPESRPAAAGFERSGSTAERPPERVIEVVRIQPPGVLPSGGSAGSAEGAAARRVAAAAVPARLPAVSVPAAAGGGSGLLTFAAVPASPMALPAFTVAPEQPSRSAANRGIVRRRPEAGPFPGLGGRTGTGSGRGFGGGGVTVTGIGTNCLIPGRSGIGGGTGLALPKSGGFGGNRAFGGGRFRR